MTAVRLSQVVRQLRGVLATRQAAELTDADLWERYVGKRDEAAFAALVGKHGPKVLGVCRRISEWFANVYFGTGDNLLRKKSW